MTVLLVAACQAALAAPGGPASHPVSEVEWTALNPARGEASPRAATLWGDRAGPGPSGFLVAFADGFSSPPHIHNVTYRAVVLTGEVYNGDAGAAPMWMVPGSFWTQPRSGSHITSARGASMVYVEIDAGPYLVHPAAQAKPVSEKPVNLDASNLVWTDAGVDGVQLTRLWGEPDAGVGGLMIRLQPGAAMHLGAAESLRTVVVAGAPTAGEARMAVGTLITEPRIRCADEADSCVLYIRTAQGVALGEAPHED